MNNEDKKNILLVEDEVLIAMTEKMELKRNGIGVKVENWNKRGI